MQKIQLTILRIIIFLGPLHFSGFMGVQRNFNNQILAGYTFSQSCRQVLLPFETIPGQVRLGRLGCRYTAISYLSSVETGTELGNQGVTIFWNSCQRELGIRNFL